MQNYVRCGSGQRLSKTETVENKCAYFTSHILPTMGKTLIYVDVTILTAVSNQWSCQQSAY